MKIRREPAVPSEILFLVAFSLLKILTIAKGHTRF